MSSGVGEFSNGMITPCIKGIHSGTRHSGTFGCLLLLGISLLGFSVQRTQCGLHRVTCRLRGIVRALLVERFGASLFHVVGINPHSVRLTFRANSDTSANSEQVASSATRCTKTLSFPFYRSHTFGASYSLASREQSSKLSGSTRSKQYIFPRYQYSGSAIVIK